MVAGLVTIDVEPDNVWANTHSRSFANIAHLPRFDALCQSYGIRPTYLVSWSIANDKANARILESLLKQGKCEIGVHPHLWKLLLWSSRMHRIRHGSDLNTQTI